MIPCDEGEDFEGFGREFDIAWSESEGSGGDILKFVAEFHSIAAFLEADFVGPLFSGVGLVELIDEGDGDAAIDIVADEGSEFSGCEGDLAADKDGRFDHFSGGDSADAFHEHGLAGGFGACGCLLEFFVESGAEGEAVCGVIVGSGR